MTAETAELVGLIYDAALDARRWQDFLIPFAVRLRSHVGMMWANNFDTRSVEIVVPGKPAPTEDMFTCWGLDPAALESFVAYYGERNVWVENPRFHHEGAVVYGEMLFPNNRLKSTEWFGDWLRPQEIFHTAAAVVEKKDDRSVNVTVCRSENAGPYEPQELELIAQLMPHLQAGFALHRRLYKLEALSQASTEALESLPLGVVLLDHAGRVLHANRLALGMARDSRLLRINGNGPCSCLMPSDDARLQRLVGQATLTGAASDDGTGGASMRLRGLDGKELHLLVTPLPSWSAPFGERTCAALFISDPAARIGSLAESLRHIYHMTPAEARVTEALVNGLTPQEYADEHRLSLNTIRTQIRHAAAKAGSRRQGDLVRTVLTGPALLSINRPTP